MSVRRANAIALTCLFAALVPLGIFAVSLTSMYEREAREREQERIERARAALLAREEAVPEPEPTERYVPPEPIRFPIY